MKKIVPIIKILILLFTSTIIFAKSNNLIKEEHFINVPGGKIWYQIIYTEKNKNKTPLIILHGGPGVPHDYLSPLEEIAKEHPVIFYDQLGCGHSVIKNNDPTLWTINRYLSELEILINHLGFKRINLFGHSWGGALAVEYGLKHPERVASLTLASPLLSSKIWISDAKYLINKLPPETQKIIHKHEKDGKTDSIEYKKAMDVFYRQFVFRMKKLPSTLQYSFDHINFEIYHTMWGVSEFSVTGNLKNYDRMNDLKKLNMPILITGGRFDEATPKTLKKVIKKLSRGKLIVYENSAHFAFITEKEKYLHDLMEFLN